jgi:hypothetical protein
MQHIMMHNDAPEVAKSCKKKVLTFYCEKCDYTTTRKSSWNKHIETKKHNAVQMLHNGTSKVAKSCMFKMFKCGCGKSYKHHQSFYRHKSMCSLKPNSGGCYSSIIKADDPDTITISKNALTGLITDVSKSLIPVLAECIGDKSSISGSGSNNTINNQKIFNVNLFLNEKCANAMSIQDFARNLQLTMDDIDKSKPDQITNVVMRNLQPLSITDRPFHCTDISGSEWYVKDQENGWGTDSGSKVIDSTEHGIRQKWPDQFVNEHPKWQTSERLQDKYVKIAWDVSSSMNKKDNDKVLGKLKETVELTEDIMAKHSTD